MYCSHQSHPVDGSVSCNLYSCWVKLSQCASCTVRVEVAELPPLEEYVEQEYMEPPSVESSQIGDCLKDAFADDGWVMTGGCSCEALRMKLNIMTSEEVDEAIVDLSKEILPNVKHAAGAKGLMARVGAAFLPGLALKIIQGYLRTCLNNSREIMGAATLHSVGP